MWCLGISLRRGFESAGVTVPRKLRSALWWKEWHSCVQQRWGKRWKLCPSASLWEEVHVNSLSDWKCFLVCFMSRKWSCCWVKGKMSVLSMLFLGEIAQTLCTSVPQGLTRRLLHGFTNMIEFYSVWKLSQLNKKKGIKIYFLKLYSKTWSWNIYLWIHGFIYIHTHLYTHEKN